MYSHDLWVAPFEFFPKNIVILAFEELKTVQFPKLDFFRILEHCDKYVKANVDHSSGTKVKEKKAWFIAFHAKVHEKEEGIESILVSNYPIILCLSSPFGKIIILFTRKMIRSAG